jgi:hypothetical protein
VVPSPPRYRLSPAAETVAPGAIVENKRLGAALAFARERQASYPPNRRRGDPRRQRPPNNLEAPGLPTKGRPSRKFWQLPPSEAGRVSFQLCTTGDISILRRHCIALLRNQGLAEAVR